MCGPILVLEAHPERYGAHFPVPSKRPSMSHRQTEVKRCPWPGSDPRYIAYHDEEWGVPERDDRALYEKLVLDGFQAGLSWITILRKRENFRRAFDDFAPEKVARYTDKKIAALPGPLSPLPLSQHWLLASCGPECNGPGDILFA